LDEAKKISGGKNPSFSRAFLGLWVFVAKILGPDRLTRLGAAI
jgi:hypothetical protein